MLNLMPAVYRYGKTRGIRINEFTVDPVAFVAFHDAESGEVLLTYRQTDTGLSLMENNIPGDRDEPAHLQDAPYWVPDSPGVHKLLRYLHGILCKNRGNHS